MADEESERRADALWMARVAEGDADACRRLANRHLRAIVAFSHRQLRDHGEAEDVAQEAFLRLWRQAPSWRPDAKIATWLYRVTNNLCIDRLRKRRERPSAPPPEMVDPEPGPWQRHHQRQVAQVVEKQLSALPERQRTAILLVHYQELGNVEAARVLNISVEALESLLARGRRRLRERLLQDRRDLLMNPGPGKGIE